MTWPNVALCYMDLFNKYVGISEKYEKTLQKVKLTHLMHLTNDFGVIQFVNHTKPDLASGYALDDNARAMIVCGMHYSIFKDASKLKLIKTYLNFIKYVQQRDGRLFNFVDINKKVNLEHWSEDSHGRALWALGFLVSIKPIPQELRNEAGQIFSKAIKTVKNIKSPRAVAIKPSPRLKIF